MMARWLPRWPLRVLGVGVLIATTATAQSASPPADTTLATNATPRCRRQLFPTLGAAPETGFEFGAGVLAVCDRAVASATRPSSLLAFALATTKQQSRIGVELERWTAGNARMLAGSAVWQSFPLPYYGIGPSAPASARELYTPRGIEIAGEVQQRFAPGWYAGGGVRTVARRITADSSGALQRTAVIGTAAGSITELSAGIQRDTRDNLFATHRGHWIQVGYGRSIPGLLSAYAYHRFRADARVYHPLGDGHVLAWQVKVVGVTHGTPFDLLPLVGGSEILRGYELGRYRDRWLAAAQAEYRTPIVHRLGGVAFAGTGAVAPELRHLLLRQLLPTAGLGLRVELDARQHTAVRADYGWGARGASGLYLGVGQAF